VQWHWRVEAIEPESLEAVRFSATRDEQARKKKETKKHRPNGIRILDDYMLVASSVSRSSFTVLTDAGVDDDDDVAAAAAAAAVDWRGRRVDGGS
jgi:hypothetical protein